MCTPCEGEPVQSDVGMREVISMVETAVTSQVCKGEISSSGKGGKAIKGKGKANKTSTELPSREGTILQVLPPPLQKTQGSVPTSQPEHFTPALPTTLLPHCFIRNTEGNSRRPLCNTLLTFGRKKENFST